MYVYMSVGISLSLSCMSVGIQSQSEFMFVGIQSESELHVFYVCIYVCRYAVTV